MDWLLFTGSVCWVTLLIVPEPQPLADVTYILSQFESGDPSAAEQLLPLVYDELRKLATARMAHESPGQTLQATALVHEAFVRLVGGHHDQGRDSRRHLFAAAAESMRRILVEQARRKKNDKYSGSGASGIDDASNRQHIAHADTGFGQDV